MASEGELGHPEGYEIVDFSSCEHYSSVYLWHSGKFQWFQFWHSVDQNVTFYISHSPSKRKRYWNMVKMS